MGVAAGGNINPDPGGVSMFEPMGGSAPKYTGQNVINPIAAINAMSMLLEHSGQPKAAARVMKAVQAGHRHEDEKPGRRQDGLLHQPSRRFGVRGDCTWLESRAAAGDIAAAGPRLLSAWRIHLQPRSFA